MTARNIGNKVDDDTVDAVAESQRLASNTALGQPINEGEVPTIRRRETRGLLEDLEGFISF